VHTHRPAVTTTKHCVSYSRSDKNAYPLRHTSTSRPQHAKNHGTTTASLFAPRNSDTGTRRPGRTKKQTLPWCRMLEGERRPRTPMPLRFARRICSLYTRTRLELCCESIVKCLHKVLDNIVLEQQSSLARASPRHVFPL